jgi:hypothetical protein
MAIEEGHADATSELAMRAVTRTYGSGDLEVTAPAGVLAERDLPLGNADLRGR